MTDAPASLMETVSISSSRWVLIADASRARLFADNAGSLALLEEFGHPESRERSRDLMADTKGRKPTGPAFRSAQPGGAGSRSYGRPGAEPDTEPKKVEAQKFARELIEYLQHRLNEHSFDALVVTAPPAFLGLLRSMIQPELEKHIEAFVNKDLTQFADRQLKEHLDRSLTT